MRKNHLGQVHFLKIVRTLLISRTMCSLSVGIICLPDVFESNLIFQGFLIELLSNLSGGMLPEFADSPEDSFMF